MLIERICTLGLCTAALFLAVDYELARQRIDAARAQTDRAINSARSALNTAEDWKRIAKDWQGASAEWQQLSDKRQDDLQVCVSMLPPQQREAFR